MKLTDLFIRRPVLSIVVSLVILLVGYQSLRSLNVRQYPRSDVAVISVTTAYVGANAELVRSYITTPLEKAIASVDGIDYMESSSTQGSSSITIHLKLNFDITAALTQIQTKIAQVRNDLPPEAEAPIIDLHTADSQFAVLYLSFYSKDLDAGQITDFLRRVIQPKLTTLSGVQKADILGARIFAMRIWLKPDRMGALHVAPRDVAKALTANNYLAAVGTTKGTMTTTNLVANTDLRNAEEFKKLVVAERNGSIIRLEDISDVELGAEDYNQTTRFNGQTAMFMGVWALPNANALDVAQAVRKIVPEIQRLLPQGMKCDLSYDSTTHIRDSIHEITKTLTEALVIVIIVIFLFLGSLRSVLIPVIAIPISLIGTAFLMLLMGFTLNLLTLLAIVLAVGLVVDDAIVVVENVERHIHEGRSPLEAALAGARELVGPIIAMTITLAAVYAPIGIQGGLTGALFREFAFTLAGAVLVSGIVALTLSPMMSAHLLRPVDNENRFSGFVNSRFLALKKKYSQALAWTLSYRSAVFVLWTFSLVCILFFYLFSVKELAPHEDVGFVEGIVQASANSTLDQTDLFAQRLSQVFQSIPEVERMFEIMNPTSGFIGVILKPLGQRKRSLDQVVTDVTEKCAQLPGINIVVTSPSPLPGAGQFPIEFVVGTTAEPRELLDLAHHLVETAFQSGLFQFADPDLKYDQPEYRINFDRDKIATLGLNLERSGSDLSIMLGGHYVNRFSNQGYSYKVIPQIKRVDRLNPEQLADTYITSQGKSLVKLSTFANISHAVQPRELKRFQQFNSAMIQGVLTPGVSIDQGLSVLEKEARKILPHGYTIDYSGESRQLRKEGNKLLATMALSLILIFLVLAAQFESFRDPLIILLGSAPLTLAGALLIPFLGITTLNIYTQIGLITLVGLISKNGILIVEFANKLQESGLNKFEAAIEASGTRLRPILMTTLATVVGNLPLVLARGPGAGARNSIGMVIVSGMMIGTFFTLFFVPAIYTLIAKRREQQHLTPPIPHLLPSSLKEA